MPVLLREIDDFLAAKALRMPRAIGLDTVARCMGEGDENSAKDMGRFVRRCGLIERHFDCVIAAVHHTGKDPTRGPRGSNALNGGADVTVAIEKFETYSIARIAEMKDGIEGQEWRFRLLPYDLDTDAPGTATPCVVDPLSEPMLRQPSTRKATRPPKGLAGDLLKVIRRAVDEAGETGTDAQAPAHVRAVTRDDLRRLQHDGLAVRRRAQQLSRNALQVSEPTSRRRHDRLRSAMGVVAMTAGRSLMEPRNLGATQPSAQLVAQEADVSH